MSFELATPQVAIYRADNGYIVVVGGRKTNRRWIADVAAALLKFVPQLPEQLKQAIDHATSGADDMEMSEDGVKPVKGSPVQVGEALSDQVSEAILPITEELKAGQPKVYVCRSEADMLGLLSELYGMPDVWDAGIEATNIEITRQMEQENEDDDAGADESGSDGKGTKR